MATTTDVSEGHFGFHPRPKYNHVFSINGIDAFFIKHMNFEKEENSSPIFFNVNNVIQKKESQKQYLILGEPISPNGAQMLLNQLKASFGLQKEEEMKNVNLTKNFSIDLPVRGITSNYIPESFGPEKFDYSIKKLDPVGTVVEQHDFYSCTVSDQNHKSDISGEITELVLTIHSEKHVFQY